MLFYCIKYAMDAIDIEILRILQIDATRSYGAIGKAVGLSVSGVNERLKKLRRRGVLLAIEARLDPAALGLDILAFVQILVDRPEAEGDLVRRIRDMPEVQECHHMTGDYSYLVKLRARDTRHLEYLIGDRIRTLPGIARTFTLIALSTAKETAAIDCRVGDA